MATGGDGSGSLNQVLEIFHLMIPLQHIAPPLFQGAHLRGGVRSTSSRLREDLQAVVYIQKS